MMRFRYYRQHHRIFPYHLAHYVCRVLRVSPFKYYSDTCYSSLAAEMSFSELPNFTVTPRSRRSRLCRTLVYGCQQTADQTQQSLAGRPQTWCESWASVG